MLVSGRMTNKMVKAPILIQMGLSMWVIGKITKDMDLAH